MCDWFCDCVCLHACTCVHVCENSTVVREKRDYTIPLALYERHIRQKRGWLVAQSRGVAQIYQPPSLSSRFPLLLIGFLGGMHFRRRTDLQDMHLLHMHLVCILLTECDQTHCFIVPCVTVIMNQRLHPQTSPAVA